MKTLLLSIAIVSIFFFSVTASAATTLEAQLISTSTSVASFGSGDIGTFEIKFKLTAMGDDVFILSDNNFHFIVYRNGSPSIATIASSVTDYTNSGYWPGYRINDGTNNVFSVTVTVDPDSSGLYDFRMTSVDWSGGSTTLDPSIYRTGYVSLSSPVPEPSRIIFLGFGLTSLAFRRRRI